MTCAMFCRLCSPSEEHPMIAATAADATTISVAATIPMHTLLGVLNLLSI
jgi:hypothetical protein